MYQHRSISSRFYQVYTQIFLYLHFISIFSKIINRDFFLSLLNLFREKKSTQRIRSNIYLDKGNFEWYIINYFVSITKQFIKELF